MDSVQLYEAIRQMRELSSQGKHFSLVHATYNRDSMQSDGIRRVRRCRIRPAAKSDKVVNSDYKLFYYDLDEQQPRNCWQMLIMFFNDKRVFIC